MTDLGDGPVGHATRSRTRGVPRPRAGEADEPLPTGGRAASRAAARQAPRGGSRAAGRAASRRKRPPRGRRVLKISAISLSVVIMVTAGAGWWFYEHLNGNINSVPIDDGAGGKEKADAFGRTPINLLVMGSDARSSTTDCKLGGGCSTTGVQSGNGNADVEMVVHISADRSNATVMSIPRDTMTQVPACKDPKSGQSTPGYYGQINSALQYGQECQVKTVHALTGITIDHFVQMDFSGVVKMSDAVGGVSVCVDADVYDTYSHLKLAKGTHTLKGTAALEFVRSRHGFGDGSDLGRTVSQHLFLSAMIRKFKSAGTLTNPSAVYNLADAATKALTVDTGLGTVKKLIGLAADLDKVPTKRMTFTTMQTGADPTNANRVVPAAAAKSLFATIANDQSLTSSSGKKSAAATATATAVAVPAAKIAVTVENGTSISGRASTVATGLIDGGFSSGTTTGNASVSATTTTLTYGTGLKAEAQTVAKAIGLASSHLKQGTGTGLTLVIGTDWPSGTTLPGGSSSPAPADTKAATSNAQASTADQSKSCAKVSTYKTVSLNGVAMTPTQAYRAATNKKDSAS
ncbi:cell envelope-related function transcriptional attenuator common domain-containing protein [Streptomyces sp. 3213]|uniref:LCP family protein n=1 Tax=Streptomyces sp. 3213.3 TaxID=1855348 RepID=UPI0008990BCC|nr:LCP family protein [Streptomyces sp. 3213.3]SEE88443.1 cell envelope-related function transcriptional attenuator common domain-containing protein [Streptomyces sp. 3213] [Streptomyces sp. 3213.3]